MADKTYLEALAENELVWQNPGVGEQLITGGEVYGATSSTNVDSGILFSELQKWILETYGSGVMFASVYDTDGDGNVNAAESVNDGAGNVKTAAQIVGHIDDLPIHRPLNDITISTSNLWSASKINTELGFKANQTSLNAHTSNTSNPHSTTHAQLSDGGANAHSVIDAHLAIGGATPGNPHGVMHSDLSDGGLNSHAQIDSHISSSGNPHSVSHAQVSPGDTYSHSQIDAHIASVLNPHAVTAAQVGAAPSSHVGDSSHLTTDERNAMTNVNQPLTALNPFATMADIPSATGHTIQDEGVDLAQRPNLNFVGPTVTVTDDPTAPTGSATKVEITASGDVTGPASSVDSNIAAFDGVNGKLLKDAGYAMPAGGAIGYVLGKASAADYDWAWIAQSGGGGIPEAPNDSYGYLRLGGTTNAWERGSRVFEQGTSPVGAFIGDAWINAPDYSINMPTVGFVDLLDSVNQKYDNGTSGLTATEVQSAIDELAASGGLSEAPNDASRTYFREGTTPGWTKSLKGYGEVTQVTAVASAGETLAVDDGNVLISNLTGAYTLTALTAALTMMSATWILQHNSNAVSYPASFKFPGGTIPDISSGNAIILGLFTSDAGVTWIVTSVVDYTL